MNVRVFLSFFQSARKSDAASQTENEEEAATRHAMGKKQTRCSRPSTAVVPALATLWQDCRGGERTIRPRSVQECKPAPQKQDVHRRRHEIDLHFNESKASHL